jgi:hypothetical protein
VNRKHDQQAARQPGSAGDPEAERSRVTGLFERARCGDKSVLPAVREALRDLETREVYGNLALRTQTVLLH